MPQQAPQMCLIELLEIHKKITHPGLANPLELVQHSFCNFLDH